MKSFTRTRANKTDAGNGSKAFCRVSNVLRSPSPDPGRSVAGMRRAHLMLIGAVFTVAGGCATPKRHAVDYKDTNRDGKIDQEYHSYLASDANWELRDENFDGRYDKKISYGYGKDVTLIDKPVPHKVPDT
jgi:hypothetical protein